MALRIGFIASFQFSDVADGWLPRPFVGGLVKSKDKAKCRDKDETGSFGVGNFVVVLNSCFENDSGSFGRSVG
jgi:hypothetical protein